MYSDYPGWESWSVPSCPNYYCELVEAAGGELLMFPAAPGKNNSKFLEVAKQADVFLYTGTNYDKLAAGTQPGSVGINTSSLLEQIPAVQNGRVFDIQKNGQGDWFESRMAEPDVVLEDLIDIITPAAADGHKRVWWRNVSAAAKEPVGGAGVLLCDDTTKPLVLKADKCGGNAKPQAPRQTARPAVIGCVQVATTTANKLGAGNPAAAASLPVAVLAAAAALAAPLLR